MILEVHSPRLGDVTGEDGVGNHDACVEELLNTEPGSGKES